MGCDGGTIPTRDEMVRVKQKPEQKDKIAERVAKWESCALSQQPLQPPIVACELGKLYSKESVIELLLDRSTFDSTNVDHVRTLKDVHELRLTANSGYARRGADKGDTGAYTDTLTSKYICPVTGLEMSGKYRFVYLAKCGCVFSKRALKEVKGDLCHKCGVVFAPDDVIVLNAEGDEVDTMRANMETRKQQSRLEKKAKKKKFAAIDAADNGPTTSKQACLDADTAYQSTSGPSTFDVRTTTSEVKKFSSKSSVSGKDRPKKASSSYTVQDNPSTSKAYKELFTSHPRAKNQMKAHWVTHDPCHY